MAESGKVLFRGPEVLYKFLIVSASGQKELQKYAVRPYGICTFGLGDGTFGKAKHGEEGRYQLKFLGPLNSEVHLGSWA